MIITRLTIEGRNWPRTQWNEHGYWFQIAFELLDPFQFIEPASFSFRLGALQQMFHKYGVVFYPVNQESKDGL